MKNYTIRFSGNTMSELSDVALRLAEQPESRPGGTDWNLTRNEDTYQIEAIVSGVTDSDDLRSALRYAARELEKGVSTAGETVEGEIWVQLKPFK